MPTIIKEFVREGKLKIEYRSLSTATGNAERVGAQPQGTFNKQQVAALAAGQQNKMWHFLELFYHEQGAEDSGYVTESYIQGIAQQVPGLNLADWTAARNDPNLAAEIPHDQQVALEHRFEGTPSFLLGKSGTTLSPLEVTTFTEPAVFAEAIKKYLP
jgi:protein-disulfide isomerase